MKQAYTVLSIKDVRKLLRKMEAAVRAARPDMRGHQLAIQCGVFDLEVDEEAVVGGRVQVCSSSFNDFQMTCP